nr:hypothetical protein [Pseudomonas sp.]
MSRPAVRPTPRVSLHVGSLAVPGYSVRDGARLAQAFQKELTRLLGEQALPQHSRHTESLQIPHFARREGERPERTGQRLARRIAQALGE